MKPLTRSTLRRSARLLAVAAALAAVSLLASACDASPYAAVVNGQTIKQTALNAELSQWSSNSAYVTAFNAAGYSAGSGSTITVGGEGSGTYNMTWVGLILDNMISASVVHQYLAATGTTPSAEVVDAARALREISQVGWYNFTPGFRDTLVERLAEEATIEPVNVATATLEQIYNQYRNYFITGICVLVSPAASEAQAKAMAAAPSASGAEQCFDQAALEQQPQSIRNALSGLGVGKAAAVQGSFGWEVMKVESRSDLPLDSDVEKVLSVALDEAEGTAISAVQTLVQSAKVRVNPAYGTWDASSGELTPPAAPAISG